MTIPLPTLPDDFRFKGPRKITADQVRAIQREAMRVALEAAATWFEETGLHSSYAEYIRALEIGT